METNNELNRDELRRFFEHIPLETPSDDFVDRVMAGVNASAEVKSVRKPYYFYMRMVLPYIITVLAVLLIFFTSDLPVFNWIPGKAYLSENLVPYLMSQLMVMKSAFASPYVSWIVLISVSAGILVLADFLLSRRRLA